MQKPLKKTKRLLQQFVILKGAEITDNDNPIEEKLPQDENRFDTDLWLKIKQYTFE